MASALLHWKRAFGWNLGKVSPTAAEQGELAAVGVTEPTAVLYAVWRRSLLLVAIVPTALSFGLTAFDIFESGFGELTPLGAGLELAWLAAIGWLAAACLMGIVQWKRPGKASSQLTIAWAMGFLLPFVFALLPVGALYHVGEVGSPSAAELTKAGREVVPELPAEGEELLAKVDPGKVERILAVQQVAVEFVLSGAAYLLLLPAALSLIPGAVNGCLRVKALLPAAQLPGWLLVCAAPVFLLFWAVIRVVANHVARSPLLVFGVLLWAGAPIWYSIRGPVFVRSQIGAAEAARIGQVKGLVLATTLLGVGLLLAFVATTKVFGLSLVGFEPSKAVATRIEELSEDDEVSWEDVQSALAESESFVYAFDLSSWRFAVDLLAKLLVVTAVFAHLALRATLSAWANDRSLRAGVGAGEYDSAAAATLGLFEGPLR